MPFDACNPDDLRTLVLTVAAASAAEPDKRERAARWFRAALELVEGEARPISLSPSVVRAIGDMSASLIQAADHAEFIAERIGRLTTRDPQEGH